MIQIRKHKNVFLKYKLAMKNSYFNDTVILFYSFFQMVQNRLYKSQLLKRLTELKKSSNFPQKPSLNPAVLYVENVLNPQNLTWDHPKRRGQNLNETVKRAMRAWPQMDSQVKGKQLLPKLAY